MTLTLTSKELPHWSVVDQWPTEGPRVARFFEKYLTLGGDFYGKPFVPMPWMRGFLDDLLRYDPDTGLRVRQHVLLGIARKNAKSTMAAGLALYFLVADKGRPGQLVVVAATTREQAGLVFNIAAQMVRQSPALSQLVSVRQNKLSCQRTGSEIRVIASQAGPAHGLNPSVVIFDELHAQYNQEFVTALETGFGARKEPLFLTITTAGYSKSRILAEKFRLGLQTGGHRIRGVPQDGPVNDPTFFMSWWGPHGMENPDWEDPAVWEACNPSWEVLNHDEFRRSLRKLPRGEFVRYRLNGWTADKTVWIPSKDWDAVAEEENPLQPGDRIVLGLDGSAVRDSTVVVGCRVSDRKLFLLGVWQNEGEGGWRVPQQEVVDLCVELAGKYEVCELAADPYGWQIALQQLADLGLFPVSFVKTNSVTWAGQATQSFYTAVMDKQLVHDGSPVFAEHIQNVRLKAANDGLVRVAKESGANPAHNDAVIAAMIAWSRVVTGEHDLGSFEPVEYWEW